ncbi:hypothetical protein PAPYR_6507 [Paratrimastix pyriformis]|uniref:Uncharacterized protein n=1 Tax=Paratrimastix pyriformis TaxID=342808 RepID=A0ABQ8UK53_9EUKA|nr:hypothetical protein PAPYR_6507 [Paratrimastix pyriformis]
MNRLILCALFLLAIPALAEDDPATMSWLDLNNPTPDPVSCSSGSDNCGFGICQNGHCLCQNGYVTYPRNAAQAARSGKPIATIGCMYPTRSRLLAFLLEFFFSFGVGYAIMGWWGLFAGQLALTLYSVFGSCLVPCAKNNAGCAIIIGGSLAIASLGLFAWWVVSLVQIGGGMIPCADGAPISSW